MAETSADDRRPLVLEDLASIRYPGEPRLSPNGKNIAFDMDDQIFVVAADGGDVRPVTSAASAANSPHWSKDGRSLYFLSDRAGSNQLWRLPLDEFGEAEQLTELRYGVSSTDLSPDFSRILLSFMDDELREEVDDELPEPFVLTRRQFKRDAGDGYITIGQSEHLYIYDLASAAMTQITSGRFAETGAAWSPDGRSVVFVSNREADPDVDYRTDIWVVAAGNTDRGRKLTRLTDDLQTKLAPAWSPDGKLIAYITAEDGVYGIQNIAVIPAAGGQPRFLTSALDRWVTSFKFSGDGTWIYFNYDDAGSSRLARVRLRDGRIETIVDGEINVTSFDVGQRGSVAVASNQRNDVSDLYILGRRGLQRLTNLNEEFFRRILVADKIKVTFTSRDKTVVEAFITTPAVFDPHKRYPAILKIHGGPLGQFTWGYDLDTQFFAANGYVVIEPNPRGSTGRGQDFIRAIYETWGITDYDDLMAAVDFAIERGYADPERLAVTGYSYGGYMTNVVITRTNRFKAAASGAGHSLIAANVGHDIYQQWYLWELGTPWEYREKYDRLSPLLRAANVETPTLFLGGRIDWNVPVLNAELFYQALQIRGIDSQLVVYPGVHHDDWPDEYDRDYLWRVAEWFDRYVKPE